MISSQWDTVGGSWEGDLLSSGMHGSGRDYDSRSMYIFQSDDHSKIS